MKTATVGEGLGFSGGSSPTLDALARSTPLEALPDLLADLARASAIATLRLHTPTVAPTEPDDVLLTPEIAAARLGLTPAQLARKRGLPFRKKIGPRIVRYSARGLERFLKRS